jgi:DNA-binding response OmpR family regulator
LARILIVEDHEKDLSVAEQAARSAGFSDIEARADIRSTKVYLEKAIGAEGSLPDLILLDLDLGHESGYELLRIRYANTRLAKIPVLIWTQLGRENYEVCALFNISGYVAKWEGPAALRDVLVKLLSEVSQE